MKDPNPFELISDVTYVVEEDEPMKEGDLVIAHYQGRMIIGSYMDLDQRKVIVGHVLGDPREFTFYGPLRKVG